MSSVLAPRRLVELAMVWIFAQGELSFILKASFFFHSLYGLSQKSFAIRSVHAVPSMIAARRKLVRLMIQHLR